jgi:hypothetical protein
MCFPNDAAAADLPKGSSSINNGVCCLEQPIPADTALPLDIDTMKTLTLLLPLFLLSLLAGCGTTDNIDRTPPDVTVNEPENDEIGAPLLISVTATDSSGIKGVSLYIDGVFLERKTQPPYTFLWYSDYWGDGRGHLLSASAVDPSGNVGMSKAITVDVLKTTKPKVEIIAPAHNAVMSDPQVLLRWKPIENTVSYTVQVSDTSSTDYLIVDVKTTATSLPVNLPAERTYRWRVLPTAVGNIYGGWTKESVFHRTNQFTSIIGRKKFDALNAIAGTADGGTILAGSTHALEKGGILVKTDASGTVQWERYFAGYDLSWFTTVIPTLDGGYLAAGQNASKEFPSDRWFVKTDRSGNMEWTKTLVHDGIQGVNSMIQTKDSGYIVCSFAETDSDKIDIVLTKYDASFELIWDRTIGGRYHDEAYHLTATSDGGLLLTGVTQRGTDMGSDRALVIRLNFLGEEKWRRDIRSAGGARFTSGTEYGGRYFLCGTSRTGDNRQDALAAAFDSTGKHLWTKTFGGHRDDAATGITASNGQIALCGNTSEDSTGVQDAWLLILDANGVKKSEHRYGGPNFDGATGIVSLGSGYALTGTTTSFSAGSSDGFLIVTDAEGTVLRRKP